jgi:hypothetical protein
VIGRLAKRANGIAVLAASGDAIENKSLRTTRIVLIR